MRNVKLNSPAHITSVYVHGPLMGSLKIWVKTQLNIAAERSVWSLLASQTQKVYGSYVQINKEIMGLAVIIWCGIVDGYIRLGIPRGSVDLSRWLLCATKVRVGLPIIKGKNTNDKEVSPAIDSTQPSLVEPQGGLGWETGLQGRSLAGWGAGST